MENLIMKIIGIKETTNMQTLELALSQELAASLAQFERLNAVLEANQSVSKGLWYNVSQDIMMLTKQLEQMEGR